MNKNIKSLEKFSNFVIFKTATGKVNVDVFFQDETLWLTQKKMAELFEKGRSTITEHLKNIFLENELDEGTVCRDFRHTAEDGKSYNTKYYNLKTITAVGYRVNSHRATEFRKWATEILHEYIIKGFVMDDERLKQTEHFGQDYFDEMLERIREIRLSERRFYQKITDIYALSADYDKNDETTKAFFATAQNKMHWAIAKNYLEEAHLKQLERIVSAYLDLAENRANRGIVMNMKDWVTFLDKFLELSDYPILLDAGKVSAVEAKLKAETEYEKYRVIQDRNYISDFDREIKKITGIKDDE